MSKNDSLSDSMGGINPIPNREDNIRISSGLYINRDEIFKDLIRYKGIAATILSLAIQEFNGLSLTEIAKLIATKGNSSTLNPLDQEIEMLDRQLGTRDDKSIEFDSAFYVSRPNRPKSRFSIDLRYLVNTEM